MSLNGIISLVHFRYGRFYNCTQVTRHVRNLNIPLRFVAIFCSLNLVMFVMALALSPQGGFQPSSISSKGTMLATVLAFQTGPPFVIAIVSMVYCLGKAVWNIFETLNLKYT